MMQDLSGRIYRLAQSTVTWLDDTLPSVAVDTDIMHKIRDLLEPLG